VLISTVRTALGAETAIFPANEEGKVTSALHLYKVRHANDAVLDGEHAALVAAVEAGSVDLVAREATPEEAQEAMGELMLLAEMARDDETTDA
jgi:hypothetical protein